MTGRIFCLLLAFVLTLGASVAFADAKDILAVSKWRTIGAGGASATSSKNEDGSVTFSRTGDKGACWYYNGGSEYPVTAGKVYHVGVAYESAVGASLMVQVMGANRTPYPSASGKEGVAELAFIAREGENKMRIHFGLKAPGEALIRRIYVEELDPADNMLLNPAVRWRVADIGGSKSKVTMGAGGRYRVSKGNDAGYAAFVPVADIDIVPGKNYQVSVTLKRANDKAKYNLMFQMPGGKRTPFPTVASKGLVNEEETMKYAFTARADERKLRPHIIIRGMGDVEIIGVSVKEISEVELKEELERRKVKQISFDGTQLKRVWRQDGVVARGDSSLPFVEFTSAPRGGLTCENLAWNASEIKALEVDFKVADEGGYLDCNFTSTVDGKTYKSHKGLSVLPDGKWHRLMFPVGEDPAWRGTITSVSFAWNGQAAPLGFKRIAGEPRINRLYDLRPRGEYTLSRLQGNAPAELRFLDRNYAEVGRTALPAGKKSVDFTMPSMAMTAQCIPENAPLFVELRQIPKLDRPAAYWRGKWIWCWNGFGPDAENVWFRRDFELESAPDEAELVVSGDDVFQAFVNGHEVGRGSDWSVPGKSDVGKHLTAGKNSIVIRVYNVQAWGGLLCELYARVKGREQYVVSDGNWSCHVGGKEMPAAFERHAMELGAPPIGPWNTRVGYQYVGPKGRIRVLKSAANSFTAEVLEPVPVDSSKLSLSLVGTDGVRRKTTAVISPRTSEWRKGMTVTVTLSFPKQFSPGTIYNESDFLVVEQGASLGKVHVVPRAVPPMSTARVVGCGSRPFIEVNGRKLAPIYYLLSGGFAKDPASRDWMIRNAKESGCEIMRFSASFQVFWKGENDFDFSALDRRLETVSALAPGTFCIISVNTGMPRWWLARHRDEMTAYFGGKKPHREKDLQALASKKWLEDARIGLRALIRHLKESPYADCVIGLALSEGWNSEWFWSYVDDNQRGAMAGYSPADYATFRGYLREHYGNDAALRKAWGINDVTIDTALMPDDKQWAKGDVGILLVPTKDMQLIDWFRFRNRSIGEAITTLAGYVKEESNGKWLAGAYYGYFLAFSNIYSRLQTVGHLDIERVARSPHIDFLTAPSYYTWRHSGQGDGVMQLAESFTSHGKLVIVEQDLRTFPETSAHEIRNGMLSTPDQSVGALDRAIALTMTRGIGTHWLEMYENWFREPLMIRVMNEGKRAYESLGPVKGTTPAEVAFISDSESAMHVQLNVGNGLHVASVGEMQRRFPEVAVPYRQVLLQDMLEPNVVPKHRFYIVNNLVMLDDGERRALMERFRREKASVLWLYAAGVTTPEKGPSAQQMSDFLGVQFRMDKGVARPRLTLQPGLGVKETVNFNSSSPWFLPVSGFSEVLGTLADGTPGLVKWEKDGVTHYFSTLMNLHPKVLQALIAKSGVHVYSTSGDSVLVGNDVVALHAKSDGAKRILLPDDCKMSAILGPIRGEFSSGESFEAKAGQTYVFLVTKF